MSYDTAYSLVYVSGSQMVPQCNHPTSPTDRFCPSCGLQITAVHVVDIIERMLKETLAYTPFNEPCSWYTHVDDMCKITKGFPETIIALYGDGEESGDLWVKYFLNGKVQREQAEIIYPIFNKSKLESPTPGKRVKDSLRIPNKNTLQK